MNVHSNVCFVCCLWVAAGACQAAETRFDYIRDIHVPSLPQEELLSVPLDGEVHAQCQDGLPDLRILDEQGQQVAYLLRKVRTIRHRTTRSSWPGRNPSVRPLVDGGLEITLQLDKKDPRPQGVRLVSPLANFEHRVRISSSSDGSNWRPMATDGVIFDYSRFMDVRSTSVPVQETADRYFQITIDQVTAEQESELLELTRHLRGAVETGRDERLKIQRRPFRIDRIEFWREDERQHAARDKKRDYPVAMTTIAQDKITGQTILQIDTRRAPLTSLTLETPNRNFSRHAIVEALDTLKKHGTSATWHQLGQGTLSRIEFKHLKRQQLSISFPESRQTTYRMVLDNRDSPPLEVSAVRAEGNVYELVILASPENRYRLLYSADGAQPPHFDTEAIRQLLGEGFEPKRAELGEQMASPDAGSPRPMQWSDLINDPRLLVGVILLLVLLLGWGLVHAARRIEDLPGE